MTEVLVFQAYVNCLESPQAYQRLYSAMPLFRREKADFFRFEKDKRLSVGVWSLLHAALLNVGCAFDMEKWGEGEHGKPFLDGCPWHFNLSHSGSSVLCALALDAEVGCDVESMDRRGELPMSICMKEGERALMNAQDSQERRSLFFRHWTLKESFMKAKGAGFGIDPITLQVRLGGGGAARVVQDGADNSVPFSCQEFFLDDGYAYAACVQAANASFELRQISLL